MSGLLGKLSAAFGHRTSDTPPPGAAEAAGGSRSPAGTNYGDFAPVPAQAGMADPSRGAEMERDVEPADASFDRAPETAPAFDTARAEAAAIGLVPAPDSGLAAGGRELRIRQAAFRRYQQRGAEGGDEVNDWLAAEAEIDEADRVASLAAQDTGPEAARRRNAAERA